ncbi:MAG: glucosyl-3-phosphoglycerate synthase [Candidatus Aenigmarchaeota archaeon]
MKVEEWFVKNRFKYKSFSHIRRLVKFKKKQKEIVSVLIPTLNEERTIGKIVHVLKSGLMDKHGLIDEIIIIDSHSTDRTREIAEEAGATVYTDSKILKKRGNWKGKGEALWKGLYVANGSIVCWVDADIRNIHTRFVYGLVGPLLTHPKIKFVKPYYKRPLRFGDKLQPLGGGRVTELLIRPLFNMYFPRLAGFTQPLSGEAAARRTALEKIPYFTGYGVETGMLIDLVKKFGLNSIAQVDLVRRIHRNQELSGLSNMAFGILQVFVKRANTLGKLILVNKIKNKYRIIERRDGEYHLKTKIITERQRPPMITLQEYRKKFKRYPKWLYV